MNPLISVIVPVYNVERYLDDCIQSIVNQTYKNLEIILIDDGSKDKSPSICDKWAEKDSRIVVVHKKNNGVSAARNTGLDIAKGDYIGFVDSDDYITENYYDFLLNLCLENDADISRCTYILYGQDKNEFLDGFSVDKVITLSGNDLFLDLCKSGHKHVVLWNKLFKKTIIENIRFDTSISAGEDLIFNCRAYANANKMVCHDLPYYYYRIHLNQQTFSSSFNYEIYRSAQAFIGIKDCPTCMYYKYYVFASMFVHDIIINDYDYSLKDIVKELRKNKKKIVSACKEVNNKHALLRFRLLMFSVPLYKLMLKAQYRIKH